MVVNHNVPALFTHLSMRRADRGLQQAMTRLSSGIRINSARDDAAGLAIANKLNYQVGGLRRASENATHGISLIQTAEGALNEVHNMLQRIRELSVQAAHGTLQNENRAMIQLEIEQLTAEIHSISRNTEYNRMRILNGEANRVVDNFHFVPGATPGMGDLQLTRSIVTTLYVSHQVSQGRLNYTIEEAGRGAMIQITPNMAARVPAIAPATNLPEVPTRLVFPPDNGFTINGVSFDMSGKEWEDIRYEINQELQFMGISMYEGTGPNAGSFFFVTNLAGSDQRITVTGNLPMIGLLGTSAFNTGRDARVTTNTPSPPITLNGETVTGGLLDANGDSVSGTSLAATTNGNQVSFRGSRGEDIRLNIQVMFDPGATATEPEDFFRFPGPGGLSIGDIGVGGLHMTKAFRSFGPIMLQIGSSHNTAMPVQIPRLNAETLGLVQYVGGHQRLMIDVRPTAVLTPGGGVRQVGADAAIKIADAAIQTVSNTRARLGAYQNRLESTVRNLDVAAENTEMSRSRIQDTDMARETTRFAQYNVIFQAAMSILAQANQRPQQIISLLQ